mmetsp:Transcript_22084/g.46495  ORF Transcript_22084/g.46495 Transcript_22084/m.46495 type:complete len:216 (-) Transcript_22084:101-748(-)
MCYLISFKRSKRLTTPTHNIHQVERPRRDRPKSSQKQVKMSPEVTVHPINVKSSEMSLKEKMILFYTVNDFRCTQSNLKALSASHQFATAQHCLEEADESLRGLELLTCRERSRNRYIANLTVLKQQISLAKTSTISADERATKLALFSAKMSAWAVAIARETALVDERRASSDRQPHHLSTTVDRHQIPSFPTFKRRVTVERDELLSNIKKRRY